MFWKTKSPAGDASAMKIQAKVPVISGSFDSGAARKKVLLVEDDPVTTKILTIALEKGGYRVFSTEDGSGALNIMRDEKVDMMIVDVDLPPDMGTYTAGLYDGFKVTRWLRFTPRGNVPTIIISASNKPEYKEKAIAAGAREFMAKPVDYSRLLASIASALNEKKNTAGGGLDGNGKIVFRAA